MKRLKVFITAIMLSMSFFLAAWHPDGGQTTIEQAWLWEDGAHIVFKTASNHYCFVTDSEEKL